MRTFLLSILLVVPWLFSSAQETTLELGFETQEAFDTNWVQVGNETQWTWLNYQAGTTSIVPVAQLDVVAPIPEKGTILAYKQGFNMKAGTGKASLNMRCGDYKKRAFEIVIATDNQFNNIVATVSYYVNGKNFGDKPMGNQYQPNSFEIPADGTYYVGFRMISQYDDVVTVEGIMMVRHLSLTYVPFVAPTPSACTNLAVESKSTESTLASELTWTWPTTDSEGNALSEVGAYIYRSTTEEGIVASQNLINTIECATQTGTGTYSDANITEPGTYYYTIVPFSANGASAIAPEVVSANIDYFDASAPISLDEAYTNNFDTEDALNGYTINPEGWSFTASNGYIHLNGGAFAAVTSALNTPAFAMQEGVEYSVTFNAWITSGNGHSFVLKAGNSPENLVAVGEAVSVTASNSAEPQKVQFIVTGNAEGKVYLAIEGTAASRATLYMDELVVEKYVAPELVISLDEAYTNSFDTEDALNGYTINPEGWSFTASNGYIHLNGGAFETTTSALNTPAFAMQEGVEYSVTFNAWITSGNGHNVVLKAGNSPENLVAVGEAVSVTASNSAEPQKVQFIVTGNAEGKVYLAIEGTAASRATLYMDELVVEKYVAPELVISLDEAYTNSFDTEDALNGYSINPEGWSFTAANGYIHLNGGAFETTTSALNTPAFAMQEGVEYSVTFNAWITSGNGHNVVLKAGNSPENLVAVGEAVNVTANNSAEPQKVQFIVTGNAEGKVYLAIEGTAASRATLYMDELVVKKYVAPELVISLDEAYTNSFDTEDALNGYTINPEGWSFTASNGYIRLNGGAYESVTSALNTPAFAMQEGVEYSVTFNAWITSGNGHNVVLKAGNSPENLVAVGEAVNVTANNSAEPQKVQFIVTGNAEGKVYLAIEGTAASRATLYMDELVVEKYVPQPAIAIGENALNVAMNSTYATLSVATSEVIGENLGEASIALYYKLTKAGAEALEGNTFVEMIAPTEENANYTAEVSYSLLEPGTYYVTIKATATEDDAIIAEDIKEAGEFTYAPTLTIDELYATHITPESLKLNVVYTSEYLPEDAVIWAVVSEVSWTESQSFAISENPAILDITGLESDKDYTFSVTLQLGDGDAIINSNTEAITIKTTGISDVTVDIANGARYFNLEGVEVRNPEKGIYIRIMDGNVSKVLVRGTK